MATTPLAKVSDVEDLWQRTITDQTQVDRVQNLLAKASALLRQKMPSVDDRVAAFTTSPTDPSALDPDVVATVVAGAVKRYLVNPDGVTSENVSLGGASKATSYVLRGMKDTDQQLGALTITPADLATLRAPQARTPMFGTIRTHSTLSPREIARQIDATGPIADLRGGDRWL